jgi:pSer/pThr/pTyr-binding forkhead associated (FHA) protein
VASGRPFEFLWGVFEIMANTPKIIVLSEKLRGQSFELTDEQYLVGRSDECDITIPEPTISGRHCTLVRNDDDSFSVRDEKSTNGTRVNGVRVEEPQRLLNSDIVQLGAVELLFDSEQKSSTSTLSTQTGISLNETAGGKKVSSMQNFSPFGSRTGAIGVQGKKGRTVMRAVVGIVVVGAVVALAFAVVSIF